MLPSDLLLVRRRSGRIWPRYAKLAPQNLEVAENLIHSYRDHVDEKKRVLQELVSELEGEGYDYRFVRGLSVLLDRRSVFECNVDADPAGLRRKVFHTAGSSGLPTTSRQRSSILKAVAQDTGMSVDRVEEALYADLDSELVLTDFEPLSAEELIKQYNVSLTQTLLFNSTEMEFTASGSWQRIFYTVKRLGLIYEVLKSDQFWVKIDGPASLFKLTRRYGTALAKLLPAIIANPEWKVEAKILSKYTNKIYKFEMKSKRHRKLLTQPQHPAFSFDSLVEEDFAMRFQALDSGWCLKREPEPVPAGKYVIIPDFSFERMSVRVFMEIMGFWTTEYLRRKIHKLNKIDTNMLIAVNEDLACEKLARMEKKGKIKIVYYRNRVPLAPILRYLEEAFQQVKEEQTLFVKNLPVTFEEPVVSFKEFAARIGVCIESVRTALTENAPEGYIVLPNSLVKKDKVVKIQKTLQKQITPTNPLSLPKATKIIEREGVEDASNILKTLGYEIIWHGISPETAQVTTPKNKQTRKNHRSEEHT